MADPRLQRWGAAALLLLVALWLVWTTVGPRLGLGRSKTQVAQVQVRSIAQQVGVWAADQGRTRLPADFELQRLVDSAQPYLRAKDLIDPWGHPYLFGTSDSPGVLCVIHSLGADGEVGGEGEDADLRSDR